MDPIMQVIGEITELENRPMPRKTRLWATTVYLNKKTKLMDDLNLLTNGEGREWYNVFKGNVDLTA